MFFNTQNCFMIFTWISFYYDLYISGEHDRKKWSISLNYHVEVAQWCWLYWTLPPPTPHMGLNKLQLKVVQIESNILFMSRNAWLLSSTYMTYGFPTSHRYWLMNPTVSSQQLVKYTLSILYEWNTLVEHSSIMTKDQNCWLVSYKLLIRRF